MLLLGCRSIFILPTGAIGLSKTEDVDQSSRLTLERPPVSASLAGTFRLQGLRLVVVVKKNPLCCPIQILILSGA